MDNSEAGNYVLGAESSEENGKERFKIIYVDDVSSSLLTLKRRLSGHYNVFPAQSSEILYKALEKMTPDIILLDINMPGVNGYEVIQTLKADTRYANIPVVFITGSRDRESVIKGLALGAADYLIKPVGTTSLIECIEKHAAESKSDKDEEKETRQRILVVDDVVSVLKTIQKILHANYMVHTISKPESVINFLKLRKPDLILLDYLMPVFNGFELIPMIRELPGYEDTPIIMLTSDGTVSQVKEAMSLGACDFIVKPFKDCELKEKIAKHIKVS